MNAVVYYVVSVLSGFVWIDCGYHLDAETANTERDNLERDHGYIATVSRRRRL
jgi:hypothetical protein